MKLVEIDHRFGLRASPEEAPIQTGKSGDLLFFLGRESFGQSSKSFVQQTGYLGSEFRRGARGVAILSLRDEYEVLGACRFESFCELKDRGYQWNVELDEPIPRDLYRRLIDGERWCLYKASDELAGGPADPVADRIGSLRGRGSGRLIVTRWEGDFFYFAFSENHSVVQYSKSDPFSEECDGVEVVYAVASEETVVPQASECIEAVCPCCGVAMMDFDAAVHISREIGFEIARVFLDTGELPDAVRSEGKLVEIVWTALS